MTAGSRRRRAWLAAVAGAGVLLLSACGGGAAGGPGAGSAAAPTAPLDVTATTLDGARFDAAEDLAGTPAVLWFWAPWCTICRAEAPDVVGVAEAFRGDVAVVGVAGRGDVEDMREFVADTSTGGFTHLVDDDGSLWSSFGVVSQPAFAFVSADGSTRVWQGSLPEDELLAAVEALASEAAAGGDTGAATGGGAAGG